MFRLRLLNCASVVPHVTKRGASGLSRMVAIDKPTGMTSHDVVNRVRRIYNERRVGHTGTLDPLASGVLVVCIGPATRLDAYLTGHGKRYRMGVAFGMSTETDDAEGAPVKAILAPAKLYDESFASEYVANMVGKGMQVPPIYSAIKSNGKKAYAEARQGNVITLAPRPFEIYDAELIEVRDCTLKDGTESVEWIIEASVSKGTYMRSIARDMGRNLHTCAYVSSLDRVVSGVVHKDACYTLEELEVSPEVAQSAVIDPLRVLCIRFSFVRDETTKAKVANGAFLQEADLSLNEPLLTEKDAPCTCTTSVFPSSEPAHNEEIVGVVIDNRLKALYEYCESEHRYRCRCVFPIGVERGRTV